MSDWVWTVKDANTGAVIEGAAVNADVSTSPCPYNPYLGETATKGANGCTSGKGYTIVGNTGSNGEYRSTIPYTCVQEVNYTVTAVGYNPTTDSYQSGSITGDVPIPVVYLTPVADVPQSNQGTGGTTTTGANVATQGFFNSYGNDLFYIGVAIVAVILIVVIIGAVRG